MSRAIVLLLLLAAVAAAQPAATCCDYLHEKHHLPRYCNINPATPTCSGTTYYATCHNYNDHGMRSGGPTPDEVLLVMGKDDGCKAAYLELMCSTWCGSCEQDSTTLAWSYRGVCSTSCERMRSACPTLVAHPIFGPQYAGCNASALPTEASGTCHIVTAGADKDNQDARDILISLIVFAFVFVVMAIIYERCIVPWYAAQTAKGIKFSYKP